MKRITLIIIGLLALTSCTPNESAFKSNVPVFEDRVVPQFEPPSEINLNVPFFPQAPDADWSMPWQEACEEAAVLLAYYYVTGQSPTKEEFKADIQKLVDWEIENYGQYEHTDVEQTIGMLLANWSLDIGHWTLLENPSVEDLKAELAQGNPIVAPFAGRQLGNPFYSGEGPLYHMMVIKGYDEENFITNDVGTKRGENFIYPYETIMSAMHEWDDEDINMGGQKVIILYNTNL